LLVAKLDTTVWPVTFITRYAIQMQLEYH